MSPEEFIHVLQATIAPCVFISGMGLLLLSMTNRFGRPIDRIRQLVGHPRATEKEQAAVRAQVEILYRRAKILRSAIFCTAAGIFLMCVMMVLIFCSRVFGINVTSLAVSCLLCGLVLPAAGLGFLIADISLALESLKIEMSSFLSTERLQ